MKKRNHLFSAFLLIYTLLNFPNAGAQIVTDKLIVHTDKDFYQMGETLWFRAFVIDSYSNSPSKYSKILMVKLLNDENELIQIKEFKIKDGKASGQLSLDKLDAFGSYELVAFTEFAENNDSKNIFRKKIHLVKSITHFNEFKVFLHSEVFQKDEQLKASISLIKGLNNPESFETFFWKLKQKDSLINQGKLETNSEGNAELTLDLPEKKNLTLTLLYKKTAEVVPIVTYLDHIDLQFLPESGELINGIQSKVAFKALTKSGQGIHIKGKIVDELGNQACTFSTQHEGMGFFYLQPEEGKTYKAILQEPLLNDSIFDLPNAKNAGACFEMNFKTIQAVFIKVKSTYPETYQLVASFHDKEFWRSKLNIKKDSLIKIPILNQPAGIIQITLLTKQNEAIAERLVFVNKYKRITYKLESNKQTYQPGEFVELKIKSTNEFGHNLPSDISLAVVNSDWSKGLDALYENYFLRSNLKGSINNASHYLEEGQPYDAHMDLLMLTHGWRRFNYQAIQSNEFKKVLSEDNYLSGQVFTKRNKPAAKAQVMMMNMKRFEMVTTITDDNGKFKISSYEYHRLNDTSEVTISANYLNSKEKLKVKLNPRFKNYDSIMGEETSVYKHPTTKEEFQTINETKRLFLKQNDTELLDEVTITAHSKAEVSKEEREKMYIIHKKDAEDLNLVQSSSSNLIKDIVTKMAPNFMDMDGRLVFRGRKTLNGVETGLLFVVDGIPVSDNYHDLEWIMAQDIESVKLITSPGAGLLYSGNARSGIMEIKLKDGLKKLKVKPQLTETEENIDVIKGFEAERVFYQPKFNSQDEQNKYRNYGATIYWNPSIQLTETGETKIKFIHGLSGGKSKVYVFGISHYGLIGYGEFSYTKD